MEFYVDLNQLGSWVIERASSINKHIPSIEIFLSLSLWQTQSHLCRDTQAILFIFSYPSSLSSFGFLRTHSIQPKHKEEFSISLSANLSTLIKTLHILASLDFPHRSGLFSHSGTIASIEATSSAFHSLLLVLFAPLVPLCLGWPNKELKLAEFRRVVDSSRSMSGRIWQQPIARAGHPASSSSSAIEWKPVTTAIASEA